MNEGDWRIKGNVNNPPTISVFCNKDVKSMREQTWGNKHEVYIMNYEYVLNVR